MVRNASNAVECFTDCASNGTSNPSNRLSRTFEIIPFFMPEESQALPGQQPVINKHVSSQGTQFDIGSFDFPNSSAVFEDGASQNARRFEMFVGNRFRADVSAAHHLAPEILVTEEGNNHCWLSALERDGCCARTSMNYTSFYSWEKPVVRGVVEHEDVFWDVISSKSTPALRHQSTNTCHFNGLEDHFGELVSVIDNNGAKSNVNRGVSSRDEVFQLLWWLKGRGQVKEHEASYVNFTAPVLRLGYKTR
ncbi:hypothetical protein HG531_003058 [Fusarium graminearum]|nr:hypothetical protein HG531_003058 [Fusarium graminearum]